MRLALIAATLVATFASGAAWAQDGAAARDLLAPGLDRLRVTDVGSLPEETSVAISRRLRLRMVGVSGTALPAVGTMRLHGRFATALVDFFPLADNGFHLSAGTRFHVRRDFFGEASNATRGLLYVPRGTGGPGRAGFRRFQPVATTGYTGSLSSSVTLGLEAGVRLGRSFMGPRAPRLLGGLPRAMRVGRTGNQPNPMVNAVLGIHF